jgi:transposase
MDFHESSTNIDHLGIVSTMCDELNLVNLIDEHAGVHPYQIVTTGQAVLSVIYNMLAIFQRPLYLSPNFMRIRPIDRLIAPGLEAEHFNDDVLGRMLDKLYNSGLEELFLKISRHAFEKFNHFLSPYLHGDTTKIEVYGQYDQYPPADGVVEIVKSYNRKKRGDFRQFAISLITCNRLPAFISTISGDVSDKKHFRELIKTYGSQIQQGFLDTKTLVFDSAFYVAKTLKMIGHDYPWITRVPETVGDAKKLILSTKKSEFKNFLTVSSSDSTNAGEKKGVGISSYKYFETSSDFAGIEQHWLVVFSQQAYKKERHEFLKKLNKKTATAQKQVDKLAKKIFNSKDQALGELEKLEATWKYHVIDRKSINWTVHPKKKDGSRGRPGKNEVMIEKYSIHCSVIIDKQAKNLELQSKGRFIIATNRVDKLENDDSWRRLSPEELFLGYKSQSNVERGFRFLKDPMFFVDAVYLEKPERIMSMAMLMGISLLVYSLCEFHLRLAMKSAGVSFDDGYRKPSEKPTIRRVFISFEGIHIRKIKVKNKLVDESVLNMISLQHKVLKLMGPKYVEKYVHGKQGLQKLVDQFGDSLE